MGGSINFTIDVGTSPFEVCLFRTDVDPEVPLGCFIFNDYGVYSTLNYWGELPEGEYRISACDSSQIITCCFSMTGITISMPSPTPTPSSTPTPTPTMCIIEVSLIPLLSPTLTPTSTLTPTPTPTVSSTSVSPTPTPTVSSTSVSPTPTPTISTTPTPSSTSVSPTPTPTVTSTSVSPTPTPTVSSTSVSPTPTPTVSSTSVSPTPTPTVTSTSVSPTPTPTVTSTSVSPTPTPTVTSTSVSPTPTPTVTSTSVSPTPTPTPTPTMQLPVEECDVFLVTGDEGSGDYRIYTYRPRTKELSYRFTHGFYSRDVASSGTRLWILVSDGGTTDGSVIKEYIVTFNPFSATYNRDLLVPDYASYYSTGLALVSADDENNDYTLLVDEWGEYRLNKVRFNDSVNGVVTYDVVYMGKFVSGDEVYNPKTGYYTVSTEDYYDPDLRNITTYGPGDRNIIHDLDVTGIVDKPYGFFEYDGDLYVVNNGANSTIYRVDPDGLVLFDTLVGIQVQGASQTIPNCSSYEPPTQVTCVSYDIEEFYATDITTTFKVVWNGCLTGVTNAHVSYNGTNYSEVSVVKNLGETISVSFVGGVGVEFVGYSNTSDRPVFNTSLNYTHTVDRDRTIYLLFEIPTIVSVAYCWTALTTSDEKIICSGCTETGCMFTSKEFYDSDHPENSVWYSDTTLSVVVNDGYYRLEGSLNDIYKIEGGVMTFYKPCEEIMIC